MPEEFDPIITQAYDAMTAGDSVSEAPASQATTDSAPADTATTAGSEAQDTFRWDNVPPEVLPHVKGFQADYTRKVTELADQRKALEAQQAQIAGLMQLQQLVNDDPTQAAAIFQQYSQMLGGVQAAPVETDPYAQVEPLSDGERFLLQRLQQMEAETKQLSAFQKQQQQQQAWNAVCQEFTELETAVGRQIPMDERERIAKHCQSRGIHNVTDGFRSMYWDQEINRAKQSGRDEASAVVQTKQALPSAPSALVDRTPTTASLPSNDRDLIGLLYDQMVADS